MSLRYALLGFISTEPASGFDLAREFGESMGWFWYASHSQIYPELRRLEEDRGVFPRLVKRLASRPEEAHDLIAGLKILAMRGNIDRARTEINWAEDALTRACRTNASSPSGSSWVTPRRCWRSTAMPNASSVSEGVLYSLRQW
jgi:hypothetical protein